MERFELLSYTWNVLSLQDVVEINPKTKPEEGLSLESEVSFIPMSSVSEDGKIINIQTKYLKDVIKGYTCFRTDDILFAKITPCMENGKRLIVPELKNNLGFGSTEFHVLRPNKLVIPKYIYYYISNEEFRREAEQNMTGSAGQKRVPTSFLQRKQILLPNITNQEKICDMLDQAGALVQKRREIIDKLDELIQSVFLDMFGDPIRNPLKLPNVELGEVTDLKLGKMLDKKSINGDNLEVYIGNKNVQWGYFDLSDLKKMDFNDSEKKIFSLRKGDLLICEGGEIGRTAIWQWNDKKIFYQKALHRARVKENKATPEYLYMVMYLYSKNNGFQDYTTSSTIAHLTAEKLRKLIIPLGGFEDQVTFSKIYNQIMEQKYLCNESLKRMENNFQAILHRVFNGELELR